MKNLKEITLLTNVSANANGTPVDLTHEEDTFVLTPVTTGGSVGLTLNIEFQSPSGNWHQVKTATYATAGFQQAIQLSALPGRAIRATVSGYSAGAITVDGFAAEMA
jgi:hypothetical protein